MTQDEIFELARQAGFDAELMKSNAKRGNPSIAEIFAKLIAEKAFDEGYSIGELAGFKEGVKIERKIREQA